MSQFRGKITKHKIGMHLSILFSNYQKVVQVLSQTCLSNSIKRQIYLSKP